MKSKLTVTLDEELIVLMSEEVYKKTRIAKKLKIIQWVFCIPAITLIFSQLLASILNRDMGWEIIYYLILLPIEAIVFWICRCGGRLSYIEKRKEEAKKIGFPVEQIVEFDEKELIVSTEVFTQKAAWDKIELVCETDNYWFVGEVFTAIIDKRMLNQEQYQMISEKCQNIKARI